MGWFWEFNIRFWPEFYMCHCWAINSIVLYWCWTAVYRKPIVLNTNISIHPYREIWAVNFEFLCQNWPRDIGSMPCLWHHNPKEWQLKFLACVVAFVCQSLFFMYTKVYFPRPKTNDTAILWRQIWPLLRAVKTYVPTPLVSSDVCRALKLTHSSLIIKVIMKATMDLEM